MNIKFQNIMQETKTEPTQTKGFIKEKELG